jgi:hypothetical protein
MIHFFNAFYVQADRFLIFWYRLTGHALLDYFFGTFIVALLCVVIGEVTVSLAIRINRRHIDAMNAEVEHKERLSLAAYKAGDKAGYQALNKQATDVWGKHFFTMIGYSAGILWPIPFALGWMQTRFAAVAFPIALPFSLLFGPSVGYLFTFIPLYILARIIFKHMRPWLPYFKNVQRTLDRRNDATIENAG